MTPNDNKTASDKWYAQWIEHWPENHLALETLMPVAIENPEYFHRTIKAILIILYKNYNHG